VAPADKKDGAEKYSNWEIDELRKECTKRNIKFIEPDNKEELIKLLWQNDHTPDWAEVYTDLLCHTSIPYEEIANRTIPQIDAIRSKLGKNIAIKIGMPGIFGGALDKPPPTSSPTGKPPKLSEFAAFCNAFNSIS